jgi:hypothetical protein
MVPIPESTLLVSMALFLQSEKGQKDSRREHLGASEIGEECDRKLWYSFRWALQERRNGRMVRILRRGDQEEKQLLEDLAGLGYELRKHSFVSGVNGHFGGTPDGLILGIPMAPHAWHVLELKTSKDELWKELAKKGVKEAQPVHYAQMQVYMRGTGTDRALYLAVNKDTDDIYEERVHLDQLFAQRLYDRAARIIGRQTLPERISDDPAWFQCRPCRWHAICHKHNEVPLRNCRTCLHVTCMVHDGQVGGWWCGVHKKHLTMQEQRDGCPSHLYLPSLLWWLEQMDATDDSVIYRQKEDGATWEDHGPV